MENSNNKIVVLDYGNYTTCTVNLQGATLTSWRIHNEEQLFVSRLAHSHQYMQVKGGIHLVFPHFGTWSFGPKYGFARSLPWVLEEEPTNLETGDVFAVFSLSDDAYTQALWGYKFKLLYKITLCRNKLNFQIGVQNLCAINPFEFHIMQHSLFRVPDVTKCEIVGLRSCVYKDLLRDDNKLCLEDNDIVKISGHTDKVYRDVPGELKVKNMMNGGTLIIQRHNVSDVQLWNPGVEQAATMSDLGEGEYKDFIAVKNGVLTKPIQLVPLSSWKASYKFEIVEPKGGKKFVQEFYDFFAGFC